MQGPGAEEGPETVVGAGDTDPWSEDTYALASGREALNRVATAAVIPGREGLTWRGGVVAMFGSDEDGSVRAYVQYLQDFDWDVSEVAILVEVQKMLQHRIAGQLMIRTNPRKRRGHGKGR